MIAQVNDKRVLDFLGLLKKYSESKNRWLKNGPDSECTQLRSKLEDEYEVIMEDISIMKASYASIPEVVDEWRFIQLQIQSLYKRVVLEK